MSDRFRSKLAGTVTVASLLLLSSISISAIVLADDRGEATELVFSSMVPLLGTWVGTVLAFYFARENFETAAATTLKASRVAADTPVVSVMIQRSQMVVKQLATGESESDVVLGDLMTLMKSKGYHRIPVLDQAGLLICVVHEALVLSFAMESRQVATDPNFLASTLQDLSVYPDLRELLKASAFVSETATVDLARSRMNAMERCNDVFVTESGREGEPVMGWLPNTLLAMIE